MKIKIPKEVPANLVPEMDEFNNKIQITDLAQVVPGKWYLAGNMKPLQAFVSDVVQFADILEKDGQPRGTVVKAHSYLKLGEPPVEIDRTNSYTFVPLVEGEATQAPAEAKAEKKASKPAKAEKKAAAPKAEKKAAKPAKAPKAAKPAKAPKAAKPTKESVRVKFADGPLGKLLIAATPVKEIAAKLNIKYSSVMSQINGATKREHPIKKIKPGVYQLKAK